MNVEELRARNRFDVELKTGLRVTLELPNMLDCMVAVNVPMPVLRHLQAIEEAKASPDGIAADGSEPDDVSLEELGHLRAANKEAVRRAVVALDGEPCELTLSDVEVGLLQEQDEILDYINRERSDPKAAPLPLATSPDSPLPETD